MSRFGRLRAFVLLGALLLFGLEPLVGRLLLPASGGGFHVWAACLLFFQSALFLGYLYTHVLSKIVGRGHLLLVLLPLAFLPIGRFLRELDPDPTSPTTSILAVLTISIAIPFVLLSTTGVIAQRWLAESDLPQRENPYQLYAASNAGSFVALLAYPLLIEPLLGLHVQRIIWSVAYLLYVGLAISLVPRGAASP
ncbi:MAG: spermidine synthase, partial [Planctomycetes bacterium]|nr:spermidine synthase [Planctomycetota bacterium]